MAIHPDIPFDRDGAHHGHLRLPYSRDDSAWGSVMIPVSVIRNGAGPTALFVAGNHGDEYEGLIALHELAATLDPATIRGRVIILPALNMPAVAAARRTSPIDGGNLNRAFPGRPDGSVTEKIAHYVARVLVPMADLVCDLHSGGKTLDFLPFAAVHVLQDKEQQAASEAAMRAFNAPHSAVMLEIDAVGMLDTEVEAQGKVFVTTELGGGGSTTVGRTAIARKGVRNLLHHLGILPGAPEIGPSMMLDMPDAACFTFADGPGLLEPLADLGDRLAAGDPIARVWTLGAPGTAPRLHHAGRAGVLISRHFPGLVQHGDCLGVVGVPV